MLHPDIIFTNARLRTLDPDQPRAEALAVTAGRIDAVGDEASIRRLMGRETEVVDLGGRAVVPGLVDAHCHLVSHGMICRREADLRGARSIVEIQDRLRRHLQELQIRPGSGAWLLGRGFDQDLLAERRWPTRADLDQVSPDIPVRITRVCGHALVANTSAIRAAAGDQNTEFRIQNSEFRSRKSEVGSWTARTSDPNPQSEDPTPRTQHPTPDTHSPLTTHPSPGAGVFTEDVMAPFQRAIPPPSDAEWLAAAAWGCSAAAAAGFTGVHCLVANREEVNALVRLRQATGRLPVRIRLQLPYALLEAARDLGVATGFGDEWLTVGAIKIFSDGSLGARTAALREDYSDEPGNRGQLLFEQAELDRRVQAVADAGFQVAVHAIGDAALESVLTAFERCRNPQPRPRVEHASLCPPDLMARMVALGVVAAVQPQFIVSDFWTVERLGPERARWAYPFRTMRERGIRLAGSTDCPVEALDALAAWRCAVERDGRRPEENLQPVEALKIFAEGPAHASGEQSVAGKLRRGMRADFIALDGGEPETSPFDQLRVAFTAVGAQIAES
jgi:predicted amidohydrolase YtcJ